MKKTRSFIVTCLLALVITSRLFCTVAKGADGVVFTNAVAVVMGERDTRDYVCWVAHERARVEALESVGLRIETGVEMFDESTSDHSRNGEQSSFKRLTRTAAMGVAKVKTLEQQWKVEGRAHVLHMVCRVTVYPDAAEKMVINPDLFREKQRANRVDDPALLFDEGVDTPLDADLQKSVKRARYYCLKGLYDAAINELMRARSQHGPTAAVHILMGHALSYKKGRYQMAINELEAAIELSPRSARPLIELARIHAFVGHRPERAIPLLRTALQLDPENEIARQMLAEQRK